jgi:hypothetical protein
MSDDGAALIEFRRRRAKLRSCFDVEQMICVLKEPSDALSGQPPSQREDQKVVRQLAVELATREPDPALLRTDVCDLGLHESHAAIEHRLAHVERNVGCSCAFESEANQRGIKDKPGPLRHQSELVFMPEFFRQRLSGDNSGKAAAEDYYVCHEISQD